MASDSDGRLDISHRRQFAHLHHLLRRRGREQVHHARNVQGRHVSTFVRMRPDANVAPRSAASAWCGTDDGKSAVLVQRESGRYGDGQAPVTTGGDGVASGGEVQSPRHRPCRRVRTRKHDMSATIVDVASWKGLRAVRPWARAWRRCRSVRPTPFRPSRLRACWRRPENREAPPAPAAA